MGRMRGNNEPIYSGVPGCEITVRDIDKGDRPCGLPQAAVWTDERDPREWVGKRVCQGHSDLGRRFLEERAKVSLKARQWLLDSNILSDGMSGAARVTACRAYCAKASREIFRPSPSIAWAGNLLRRIEDGEHVPMLARRMAEDVMRVAGLGESQDEADE